MGNGMNKVLPGLYVGNYRDSKDASQLERHRITHIIAIHDAARRIHTDKEYLCIMASDSPYQNLSQYFPACNDFIHSARIQGGNVLIHCLAGMSRSVTIAVAYIMSATTLRWNDALKVVRGARAVSNPNSGFQKQLQEFESTKLPEERRRLLEKFPGTTYPENDEEQCKKLLVAYNNMVLSRAICEGRCTSAKVCPTGTCRAHASPRLGRHKSIGERTMSQQEPVGSSQFRGSTKSLDSASVACQQQPQQQQTQEPPGSPRSWERHYGCWKNHFRHRQGTSSTPSTPILYRASKPQRTDSVTSISSISSISSLPGQMIINEGVKDPVPISSNVLERNPFLATQSCPNSPRRMPRKPPQRNEVSNLVRISSIASVSSREKLNTSVSSSNTTSGPGIAASSSKQGSSTSGTIGGTISKQRPSSASAVLSSSSSTKTSALSSRVSAANSGNASGSATAQASSAAGGAGGTSSPSHSPWGTPPSSPASSSGNRFALRKANQGSKNVTVTASGATRWVMKRSAYKFSLDNS
ncbi:unnamed protein product [Orchesella dallaii]|uniref:Dual specificity protein phosphatase 22 n=1 Tax=Orchesella dallaii TaxID=48710 RepID=A0ABP1PMW9_9HEXA